MSNSYILHINPSEQLRQLADIFEDAASEVYGRPGVRQSFDGYYSLQANEPEGQRQPNFCILAACYIHHNHLTTEEAQKFFGAPLEGGTIIAPADILNEWGIKDFSLENMALSEINLPDDWIDADLADIVAQYLNDTMRFAPDRIVAWLRETANILPEEAELEFYPSGWRVHNPDFELEDG